MVKNLTIFGVGQTGETFSERTKIKVGKTQDYSVYRKKKKEKIAGGSRF